MTSAIWVSMVVQDEGVFNRLVYICTSRVESVFKNDTKLSERVNSFQALT